MLIFVYSLLIILYIISRFIGHEFLSYAVGLFSVITLIVSFSYSKGLYRNSGIVFFSIAFILFIQNKMQWYEIFLHYETMLGVLSLFLVLPFINSLIRVGRYDKNLSLFIEQGVTKLNKLYKRSFLVTHLLGLFLNIATIPLLAKSLKNTIDQLPNKTSNKFYSQNLLRAYALCLTWSPMEVMVSTSLDITNTNFLQIFPIIISIAFTAIMTDWVLSSFKFREDLTVIPTSKTVLTINVRKKIYELLVLLTILIVTASLLQSTLNKGYLLSIVLLIMPISISWASIIGRFKRYFQIAVPHWKERTNGLSNYFFMFLSAGFFVEMLSFSGHLKFVQSAFYATMDKTLLLYLIIAAFFLVTSLIGFHPLVSITLIAELLNPIISNVSAVSLTIVLIACSLSTVMYSPYNLSVSILAEQIKMNPYRLGLFNLPFAIFYILLSVSAAFIISLFL